MREPDRLPERELLTTRRDTCAAARPLTDERQQREQGVVQWRPGAEVGAVRRAQRCLGVCPDVSLDTATARNAAITTKAATRITNVAVPMPREYPP